jgi:hypothetical protein
MPISCRSWRRGLPWSTGWARLGSNQRPLACKIRARRSGWVIRGHEQADSLIVVRPGPGPTGPVAVTVAVMDARHSEENDHLDANCRQGGRRRSSTPLTCHLESPQDDVRRSGCCTSLLYRPPPTAASKTCPAVTAARGRGDDATGRHGTATVACRQA